MKHVYTITNEDVGRAFITLPDCAYCGAKGKRVSTYDFIGRIIPPDVGKKVYQLESGSLAIENGEQLAERLENEAI